MPLRCPSCRSAALRIGGGGVLIALAACGGGGGDDATSGPGGGGTPGSPTVAISATPAAVPRDSQAGVTFAFSEPVTGFSSTDVLASGAAIADLQTSDGRIFTAILRPLADGSATAATLAIPLGACADADGDPLVAAAGTATSPGIAATAVIAIAPAETPVARPAWASDGPIGFGADGYGAWAAIAFTRDAANVVMRFRWIRAGGSIRGSHADEAGRGADEDPRAVGFSRGYWIAETETTQQQWRAVMGTNPSSRIGDDLPVERVDWYGATAFAAALSAIPEVAGKGFAADLPTEAQWEHAARAGGQSPFAVAPVDLDRINVAPSAVDPYIRIGVARGRIIAVDALPANAWGLFAMHGNVEEWCRDRYGAYPPRPPAPPATDPAAVADPVIDPPGPAVGALRVARGGSYTSSARRARSAGRDARDPAATSSDLGFRIVVAAPAAPSGLAGAAGAEGARLAMHRR